MCVDYIFVNKLFYIECARERESATKAIVATQKKTNIRNESTQTIIITGNVHMRNNIITIMKKERREVNKKKNETEKGSTENRQELLAMPD